MLGKTASIVLHQIKFTDSGIIVHFYTREFGRVPVLIKGMRRNKSGKANSLFQPMSLLDIELYLKSSRQVQLLREASLSRPYSGIYSDIRKTTVLLFIAETLSTVLVEEIPNHPLFDYIVNSLAWYDEKQENCMNFHISFLFGLCAFLGFEPSPEKSSEEKYFDLMNGQFVINAPSHGEYISGSNAELFGTFLGASTDKAAGIPMTGRQRNELADIIIRYYTLHLPGLRKIQSLEVLKDVFG